MRVAVLIMLLGVVGCAAQKLSLMPPPGVDLSGHWQLNEAESDDPMRVSESQTAASTSAANAGSGGQGGSGGRGGRGRNGSASSGGYGGGPSGPAVPPMSALREGLRWPGKSLDVQQTAGAVTISSMDRRQVYVPATDHHRPSGAETTPGRALPDRNRRGDGPPAACGWDDRTLVIESNDGEDDRPLFEQRYSLSEDGSRLIEVVAFKGGRSAGFVVSRVWDRAPVAAEP